MRPLLPILNSVLLVAPLLGRAQEGQEEATPAPAPAPRPVLEVGDSLPPVVIEELAQTPARSFSEFYGRAVLLEFFAYWCAPCAQSVPHLNELQETYGPRGLSVLAVTTEKAKKTLPWIEKNGVEYAWGRDPGELHSLFGVQSIPSAVLVDSFGTVQWKGDPRRLRGDIIEGVLAGTLAKPVWEWPEEARPLAGLLERSEFAAALETAAMLPASEGFDAQAIVRGRVAPMLARFDSLIEGKDYVTAFELGERLEKGLATLPEGLQLGARLKELRADPEIARIVAAEARVLELEAGLAAVRKQADAKTLRDQVVEFLASKPGEKCERRAKVLLETLDRGLAKAKKSPPQQQ